MAGVRSRPPAAPSSQVSATATSAPTNAASGTPIGRSAVASPVAVRIAITAVTPSPAPRRRRAGTGRPAGCGRRPGRRPPARASIAPTSSPSTTRGSRSSVTIATSRSVRPLWMWTPGSRLSSSAATPTGRQRDRPERQPGEHARPAPPATPPASHAGRRPAGRASAGRVARPRRCVTDAAVTPGPWPPRRRRPGRRSTTRGPQRDAMSSSSATTCPFSTAVDAGPARPRPDRAGGLLAALACRPGRSCPGWP